MLLRDRRGARRDDVDGGASEGLEIALGLLALCSLAQRLLFPAVRGLTRAIGGGVASSMLDPGLGGESSGGGEVQKMEGVPGSGG